MPEATLIDTSVWISHFRRNESQLVSLLEEGSVHCHPFIIGELACGNLKNRQEILTLMRSLPTVELAESEEILTFIEETRLMGKGLGYVDVHLLCSAVLSRVPIWTLDKPLARTALDLGVGFLPL